MKKRFGFTLIELLVVISIIALLVAVLMPALANARRQATGAVCMTNVKALSLAWAMYADDNEGRIVGGNTYLVTTTGASTVDWNNGKPSEAWVLPPVNNDATLDPLHREQEGLRRGRLYKYVNSFDVYHCPGDKRELSGSITTRNPNGYVSFRSYGIVGTMNGENTSQSVKRINEIRPPSEKLVFLEEMDDRGWNMGSWIMYTTPNSYQWIDPLTIWHNKQGTLGFADGHSEMHRWEDQRTLDAAEQRLFNQTHPGSVDWMYMWRAYPVKK